MKEPIPEKLPLKNKDKTSSSVVSAQFRPPGSRNGRRTHPRKHPHQEPFIVLWDEMENLTHDHF